MYVLGPTEERDSGDGVGDIQKKLVPWRSMVPEQDLQLDTASYSKKQHSLGGLVLVTSLIDKIPNLGGQSVITTTDVHYNTVKPKSEANC